jgi:hypothetical protein
MMKNGRTGDRGRPKINALFANDIGPLWFSFFLTSFSENVAVGRIWL